MGTNDELDDDAEIFGVGTKKPSSILKAQAKVPEVPVATKLEQAASYNEKMKSAFATIIKMFKEAKASGVQYPKFRAEGLILSPAPDHGRNPGAVYVKRIVEGGEDIYLGVIVPPGEFMPKPVCTMGDSNALTRITESPLESAVAYGRQTGRCSICAKTLTNKVSIARGIGPICAGRFGFASAFTAEEIKADKDEVEVKASAPVAPTVVQPHPLDDTASLNATAEINGLDVTKAELIGKFVSVIVDGNHTVDEQLVKLLGKFADTIINTNK